MRYTRRQRGGESMKLPDEFIAKEIVENQLFRQTMNFRVSDIERKLKLIKGLLESLFSPNNNAQLKVKTLGGTRKRKRAGSKKMT